MNTTYRRAKRIKRAMDMAGTMLAMGIVISAAILEWMRQSHH